MPIDMFMVVMSVHASLSKVIGELPYLLRNTLPLVRFEIIVDFVIQRPRMADEEQQTIIDDSKEVEVPGTLHVVYCDVCTFPPEV